MFRKLTQIRRARAASLYLLSNLASAAVPFLMLPFLVRLISPAEYGQVALFQGLITVSLALVGLGSISSAKRRYVLQDERNRESDYASYIGTILVVLVLTISIGLLLVFLLSDWLGDLTGFTLSILFFSIVISAAKFVTDLRLGDYQIRRQVNRYAIFQFSLALTNGAASVVLVYFFLRNAEGRIFGIGLAFAAFALIAIMSMYRAGRIRFGVTREKFRKVLEFGIPLIPHTVGMFLLGSVDRFFLAEYSGLEMAGIYAAGMQLTFMLRVLADSINKSFQPWVFELMARGRDIDHDRIVAAYARLTVLTIVLATLFAILSPLLVDLILGERYLDTIEFIPILAFGCACHGIYLYFLNLLLFNGQTGKISIVTSVVGVFTLGALFLLVPPFGAIGAAAAFAAGSFVRMLGVVLMARSQSGISWRLPSFAVLLEMDR